MRGPVLDQRNTSSCTGHALAHCLNTTYFAGTRGIRRRYLDSRAAMDLYSAATARDEFPGQYPPNDGGSSSLGVCKAGVDLGYLSGYRHTFTLAQAISAIQVQPGIAGLPWYEGMFDTDNAGFIRPTGRMIGGHEVTVLGVNLPARYVTILSSWGPLWGINGRAKIRWQDFDKLLHEQGDVTFPVAAVHG